jgi:hypothetical protein
VTGPTYAYRACKATLPRPHPWHDHICRRDWGHADEHGCERCGKTWRDG